MDFEKLTFKKLRKEGVSTLVQWARREGWNPGPFDAEVFWQTDPDGFWGFFLEDKLIAGGAIVSYNEEYGFMGLFIVSPKYRNQGVGRKLWHLRRDALLERLKGNAPIGMDGVVEMQPFYRKGGFEIAFIDKRYEKFGQPLRLNRNISPIEAEDVAEIMAYDKQCFGFSRPRFLNPWLHIPENRTFKYKEGHFLKGFVVLRKAFSGYKIGPLFADNNFIAEELYRACLNSVIGEPVYLDIPMTNEGAVKLVEKYHAKYVFECARMYYGKPPEHDLNKVYGITTFELG
jgi:GNAT superfamily N-acetyltransferase